MIFLNSFFYSKNDSIIIYTDPGGLTDYDEEIDGGYFDRSVKSFMKGTSGLWSNHEVEICKKLTA